MSAPVDWAAWAGVGVSVVAAGIAAYTVVESKDARRIAREALAESRRQSSAQERIAGEIEGLGLVIERVGPALRLRNTTKEPLDITVLSQKGVDWPTPDQLRLDSQQSVRFGVYPQTLGGGPPPESLLVPRIWRIRAASRSIPAVTWRCMRRASSQSRLASRFQRTLIPTSTAATEVEDPP